MKGNRMRVGLVGCGVGREHLAAYARLADRFEVTVLCDKDLPRAEALAAQHGIPSATESFSELCRRDDVDVVDVCTPSFLHAENSLEALSCGRHVICEKPVAGSLRDIDRLVEAEARSGRRVMPIFQNRFGAGVQKLKALIARGVAGRAYLATSETSWRRRPDYYSVPWRGKWKTELGGPTVTLAIHAIDLLLFVLGPAHSVFARAATRVNRIETEDCMAATVEMADGSLCTISLTTGSSEEVSRVRFCFEGMSAESNCTPYAYAAEPWRIVGDSPEHEARIAEVVRDLPRLPEGFEGQFARFHQAMEAGGPPPVTLAEARSVLEVITAIYLSAATHRAVELPIDAALPAYRDWRWS